MSGALRTSLATFVRAELARGQPELDVEKDSLVDSGVIDSVGIMKLVSFIEKELHVKIGDEDLLPENFETLSDIVKLVESKRA